MIKKFIIKICGDLDYEELVADICYEESEGVDRGVAMITQENGPDNMEIEIFIPRGGLDSWKLSLDDFIRTLENAKKTLIRMQKLPED